MLTWPRRTGSRGTHGRRGASRRGLRLARRAGGLRGQGGDEEAEQRPLRRDGRGLVELTGGRARAGAGSDWRDGLGGLRGQAGIKRPSSAPSAATGTQAGWPRQRQGSARSRRRRGRARAAEVGNQRARGRGEVPQVSQAAGTGAAAALAADSRSRRVSQKRSTAASRSGGLDEAHGTVAAVRRRPGPASPGSARLAREEAEAPEAAASVSGPLAAVTDSRGRGLGGSHGRSGQAHLGRLVGEAIADSLGGEGRQPAPAGSRCGLGGGDRDSSRKARASRES
ncbi:hypothetical protein HNR73_004308 [Phytomonospora endophytica]|uniref:Uncharacterized protein n=1 Tax=Phytomonospora endophytica TaxID=714109 RepID=A0A841FSZ5_9ACTN|nr:hypothetical protein [Phytomonospora endophytica]